MYVVRRPFRNFGNVLTPGSIIEPGNVKHFKARLRDRAIVEVSAHNIAEWNSYFTDKFGVSIMPPQSKSTPVEPAENAQQAKAAKPAVAKLTPKK